MPQPAPERRLGLYLLPLAFALLLALSAGALLVAGWVGRPPAGKRVALHVRTACPEPWGALLRERAELVGLGEPVVRVSTGGPVVLEARVPGRGDDRRALPAVLLGAGTFRIEADGRPVAGNEAVDGVRMGLDATGAPYVAVTLAPGARAELEALPATARLAARLDDATFDLGPRGALDLEEIRLRPRGQTAREDLHDAADWTILLASGPAPCPASLERWEPLAGDGAGD